jgi:hypothetical protein
LWIFIRQHNSMLQCDGGPSSLSFISIFVLVKIESL